MNNTIDRRAFIVAGAAVIASLPLAGCGGGSSYPPVAASAGPQARAPKSGRRFEVLPRQHLLEITEPGGRKHRHGGLGTSLGRLNGPAGVAAVDSHAYVVESGNHRVQVFDGAGEAQGSFGEGELLYPGGIAAGERQLYVADSRHARVVVFDPQGQVLGVLGAGVLSAPRGMAVLKDGLLVADPGLRQVLKLGFDGGVLGRFGEHWALPWDVAADADFIYVADVSRSELAVLDASGARVDAIPTARAPRNVQYEGGELRIA